MANTKHGEQPHLKFGWRPDARGRSYRALVTINAAGENAEEIGLSNRGITALLGEMNLASFIQEGSLAQIP